MKVLSVLVIFIWSAPTYTFLEGISSLPDGVTLNPDQRLKVEAAPQNFKSILEESFKANNRFRISYAILFTHLASLSTHHASLSSQHAKICSIKAELEMMMPATDLLCAMTCFKYDTDEVYIESGMKNIKCSSSSTTTQSILNGAQSIKVTSRIPASSTIFKFPIPKRLPKRIYNLYAADRMHHDEIDDRPKRASGKDWVKDKRWFGQWYVVATADPKQLQLHVGKKCAEFAENLQGNLTAYYNQLDSKTKTQRGYTSKKKLAEYFAAIIVRSYRFSNHYLYGHYFAIQQELGTLKLTDRDEALSTALKKAIPHWYFDQEHIDLINIFRKSKGCPNLVFLNFKISFRRHGDLEEIDVPGVRDCGTQKSWKAEILENRR